MNIFDFSPVDARQVEEDALRKIDWFVPTDVQNQLEAIQHFVGIWRQKRGG